jgi:hypothetical protein
MHGTINVAAAVGVLLVLVATFAVFLAKGP